MPHNRKSAFSLIELLVVVTIIIALLAILLPSMSAAMLVAERTQCLTRQRSIGQALTTYASDNYGIYPSRTMPDAIHFADAYGYRSDYPYYGANSGRGPLGLGLLVKTGILPTSGLGDIIHCPSLDNLANPSTGAAGHCMDADGGPSGNWYGGSAWQELPYHRILGGYNYRGTGFQVKYKTPPSAGDVTANFPMLIDTPDIRFRGPQSLYNNHGGYNLVNGDGSGRWLEDPEYVVDSYAYLSGPAGTTDGRRHNDEPLFEYVATAP